MDEIQQYQGWDIATAEAQAAEVEETSGGKATFMKLNVGRNLVRFLPSLVAGQSPLVVSSQHYIELPGRPKVVFVCPRVMAKQPCPACQKAEQLKATGKQADRDAAFTLFPRQRIFANVIDRAHPDLGPIILAFGKTVFEQLVSLRKDPDVGDFTRTDASGFDIIIERKGTTKNDTEYTVRPSVKPCPLVAPGLDPGVVSMQPDLSRYTKVQTWDEIVAMLRGDQGTQQGAQGAQQGAPVAVPALPPPPPPPAPVAPVGSPPPPAAGNPWF